MTAKVTNPHYRFHCQVTVVHDNGELILDRILWAKNEDDAYWWADGKLDNMGIHDHENYNINVKPL